MKRRKKKKESIFTKMRNWTISLILSVLMLCGLNAYSQQGLKFAQVSDVHFSTYGKNTTFKLTGDSPALLDDAINQLNEIPNLEFVMFTGDLIDKSFENQLTALMPHLANLKHKWYYAYGNHDTCVGGYLTPEVYRDIIKKNNPNFNFNSNYYSFSPQKGYKVIVLDSIIREEITSNGRISDTQLKWLDEELKKSQKDTVLIFTHVPVIEPFSSPGHRLKNASEVKGIIEKYKNPIAVFQGHYHGAKIIQENNVLFVSAPALVSYPNAFRIVTVSNHRNDVTFNIQMKETNEINLQKAAKIMTFGASVYTGEEKDRNAIITIKK